MRDGGWLAAAALALTLATGFLASVWAALALSARLASMIGG